MARFSFPIGWHSYEFLETDSRSSSPGRRSNCGWCGRPARPSSRRRVRFTYYRLARWYMFKPKIPIRVNFGGPSNGKCWLIYFMTIWTILRTFGIFYDYFVNFMIIWYIRYHVPIKIWQPWFINWADLYYIVSLIDRATSQFLLSKAQP
jgi:hypothetical protein